MRIALGLLVVLGCSAFLAHAEVPNKSTEQLQKIATHVITGEVRTIYKRVKMHGHMRRTDYVAAVAIKKVEKGEGLKAGDLVYVRYWDQGWTGPPPGPVGAGGHHPMPKEGAVRRIYLAKNAHDGYEVTKDGGFNVVGPNGFQRPMKKTAR